MTRAERAGIENGIWLCATCATLIDRDEERFRKELLREWKLQHEAECREQVGRSTAGWEAFDGEIEAAQSLFREQKLAAGIDRLSQIRARHWDKLSPRQRYRTLANLGHGHLGQNDERRAAALFAEAAYYQPDDADAQSLIARVSEIGGDREAAYELARELVAKSCKRAAPTYVRSAPREVSTATLANATRLWHSEHELLVALTVRAINTQEFELATELASKLDTTFPDRPEGPLFAGKIVRVQCVWNMHAASRGQSAALDEGELEHADRCLTDAYQRSDRARLPPAAADALLTRYHIRVLQRRLADALKDLEEASRLKPGDAEILIERAMRADRQLGIQLLRDAIGAGAGDRGRLLLATQLSEDDAALTEAHELLVRVANGKSELQLEGIALAFDVALALEDKSSADALLSLAAQQDACLNGVLLAARALLAGDRAAALQHAQATLAQVQIGVTPAGTRRRLARLLNELDEHDVTLQLWESLAVPGLESPDLRALTYSALSAGKHDLVLRQCVALRENGLWLSDYVNLEASLLELYDPEGAYDLLSEYLTRCPDDKIAALRRCFVCVRTDRTAEAVVDLGRLPAATGSLPMATATAQLLHVTGQHELVLSYSYDVLRAHWDEADAHMLFYRMHVETEPRLRPVTPDRIGAGVAICYSEKERQTERWIVIEDADVLYPQLGEVRPDSELARAFAGKMVGDTVTLSEGIAPRRAEIARVEHKYVYRWQQCGEEYQLNFPGRRGIQSFQIGGDDQPLEERFAAMYKAAEQRSVRVSDVLEAYRSSPLTLDALAEGLGVDVITCVLGLAGDDTMVVNAALNDENRHRGSIAAVKEVSRLIIAPTAIGTIIALGIEADLSGWGWCVQITPSTRDLMRAFVKQHSNPRERARFGRSEAGYVFERIDVERMGGLASRVQALLDASEVIPVRQLAGMNKEHREQLVQLHGQSGAESLAATLDGDAFSWSDDYTVAFTADAFGGLTGGTQSVALAAVERGQLTAARGEELSARLLGFRYEAVWFTNKIVEAAARLAEYDPRRQPLSRIVELLGRNDRPAFQIVSSALDLIYILAHNIETDTTRTSALVAVLDELGKREHGTVLIARIRGAIPARFGLSAIRGARAQQVVTGWLGTRARSG